jgi:conjugative transfer signal peptidase TraF
MAPGTATVWRLTVAEWGRGWLYLPRSGEAVVQEAGALETMRRAGRRSVVVVGQDKNNTVLHRATSDFFSVPRQYSRRHRTVRAVWHGVMRTVRYRAVFNMPWSRRRRFLSVSAGLFAGAILLIIAGQLFALWITLTDSAAPAGIYRLIAAPAARSELVAACLSPAIARTGLARGYLRAGDCPAGAEPVAKVIGALPGDVIDIEPGWAAVDGMHFPNSRTARRDSRGRPLAHVAWGLRRVAPGEVWLFGFNDVRSWDARYFGPVPQVQVRGVLRPVLTW